MEEKLKLLLEECSIDFKKTEEYSILGAYHSRGNMLNMDERLAIFKSVNSIFKPAFDLIKTSAPSLSETDLVFCALSTQGFGTVAIADCFAVSKEAVRIRKYRLRDKLDDKLFSLLFGETKRYNSESVTLQTSENLDAAIPLSHELLKEKKVMGEKILKEKMSFGKAVGVALSKLFTFEGRARRSEYWYFTLFIFLLSSSLSIIGKMYDNYIVLCLGENAESAFRYSGSVIELIVYTITSGIMCLSITIRRLHDIDYSGWLALLFVVLPFFMTIMISHLYLSPNSLLHQPNIPQDVMINAAATAVTAVLFLLVISIVNIVLFCRPGTEGPNIYGPNPIRFVNESKTC